MLRFRQLTFGKYGHTLNRRQSISPDGKWIVYDTRNEDSHIARTHAIEMVSVDTGEISRLYETVQPTNAGPGVGAAAFHPGLNQIVFIHGLECCNDAFPYSAARRFGAILKLPQSTSEAPRWMHAEPRVIQPDHPSFDSWGVLSGGTHAHSWNELGWISFTYNDYHLESQSRADPTIRDARTVGFMVSQPNSLSSQIGSPEFGSIDEHNFAGSFSAFLAATIHAYPTPGSDEIRQAVEECWVGNKGYRKSDAEVPTLALAFQGTVVTDSGREFQEVFLCDLPDQANLPVACSKANQPATRMNDRLAPIAGCRQRRLTFTAERTYPGIQGPRNWLVSSPSGDCLFFPMKDERSVVQLCCVATAGGRLDQVSELATSIESQISLSQDGSRCAFLSDQRIVCIDLATGTSRFVTPRSDIESNDMQLTGAVQFLSNDRFVCNAYVGTGDERYLQIYIAQ
jgi:hypothetical protein